MPTLDLRVYLWSWGSAETGAEECSSVSAEPLLLFVTYLWYVPRGQETRLHVSSIDSHQGQSQRRTLLDSANFFLKTSDMF